MLENLEKRHQTKSRDIFLLALNYHSVDSGDFSENDKQVLKSKLLKDWGKINEKLIFNGHESKHLLEICSLNDAHDVAYNVLNHADNIRKNYDL